MRERLKRFAELALTRSGGPRALRALWPGTVAIVAYHNVVHAEDGGFGDASLHLDLDRFVAQIERLQATHDIVALDALETRVPKDRPLAVVTFDDAYEGAVALALPELAQRGIPATVFVAPALLGCRATWWDESAARGVLEDDWRVRALESLGGRSDVIRAELPSTAATELPHSYRIASLESLEGAAYPGLTLGSHTWAHEYLPALGPEELRETLARSLAWIEARREPVTRWLALPYGGYSATVETSALELGYRGVLLVEGGALRNGVGASHCLPRINVPAGLSPEGFELRASGLRLG